MYINNILKLIKYEMEIEYNKIKLIIIEGIDCIGKSTIIKKLVEKYDDYNVMIRHFGKPYKKDNDPFSFQKYAFANEIDLIKKISLNQIAYYKFYDNIVIWNRSHIGEYVYGPLYRNENKNIIKNLIDNINKRLNNIAALDIYYIYLDGSAELSLINEDGESINTDINFKLKEIELFNEIYDKLNIQNKIKINVGNNKEFRDINEIMYNINNFIND